MLKTHRDVSLASRLWVAAHRLWPSLSTQPVFEGTGSFDPLEWRRAVEVASAANPGSRMVLKDHLGFSHWVDSGVTPPVRVISADEWDSHGSVGSDVINNYSPRKGPMAEVVLIPGEPSRVVFRSHHALMDGHGVMIWVEDIFRALRGETVEGSDDSFTENDLLNLSTERPAKIVSSRYIAPTGRAMGSERGIVWRQKTITGRYSKVLPRIILLASREAWMHSEGKVRFNIPVDLRPRRPSLKSTSNLTNAVNVDVGPDSTIQSISDDISRKVREKQDGYLTWEEKMLSMLPLAMLERVFLKEALSGHRTGLYRSSGIMSNMGVYSLERFTGGGFTPHSFCATAVCPELCPFSLCMVGTGDEVCLSLAMPRVLANAGRIDEILDRITEGLVPEKTEPHKAAVPPADHYERNPRAAAAGMGEA